MIARSRASSHTITKLNSTPLSQNVTKLLKQPPGNNLALVNLLEWAAANHYSDPILAEQELGQAVLAQATDPEALYDALSAPELETAESLPDAAAILVSRLSDLLDDRSLPEPWTPA